MKDCWAWRCLILIVLCWPAATVAVAQSMAFVAPHHAANQPLAGLSSAKKAAAGDAASRRAAARRFLEQRGLLQGKSSGASKLSYVPTASAFTQARQGRAAAVRQRFTPPRVHGSPNLTAAWTALGPAQTITPAYGLVTGRVTSIAIDSSSAPMAVYVGTTGGGVWKSTNATGPAASVSFLPITDGAPPSGTGVGSLSIGAVTVQPGGTGVVLAGTGDPNDALDSYYGEGVLRSADFGATWTAIDEADKNGGGQPHSFIGEGFAGFAWGVVSASPVVVAAVTQALDGVVVNALEPNSFEGLYYSNDAGMSWQLATIMDGPGNTVQGPGSNGSVIYAGSEPFVYDGNAATSVVWNPVRQMFYAAIRYHGYYGSPDGVTWTRLANQPGTGLSPLSCPTNPGSIGAPGCPMFRGALAVQPVTGDMFAFTVDANDIDQGIWWDTCGQQGNGGCSTTVTFGVPVPDIADLEDASGHISQGSYDLWLAAVPSNADTLLYAGTVDIYKRSLAETSSHWRNTTSSYGCDSAQVGASQHAVAANGPLMFFGNDSGLWRTTDGIGQQVAPCSADDATHFDNLNGGLGSLAEVTEIAQDPLNGGTLLVGQGVNGTSATTMASAAGTPWAQVLDGLASYVAIDPGDTQNWYAGSGEGLSVYLCEVGGACDASDFPDMPAVGDAQTASDGETLESPAVWILDPADSTQMIAGTCRVWRGDASGALGSWNALSPVLDIASDPGCNGEGQIRSLGASGMLATPTEAGLAQEILYVGMDGTLDGGGTAAGHVFTANVAAGATAVATWTDLFTSPVVNDVANAGQFNPGGFAISSVVADTHDASGQTVYATIQGISNMDVSEPLVYLSTNQGKSWTNITSNLPDVPINGLLVDPADANTVYVATDAGVWVTTNVSSCGSLNCWIAFGTGVPDAPVTAVTAWGADAAGVLRAATYGRGVWETSLVSAEAFVPPTAISFAPASLTFAPQLESVTSAPQIITITNAGASPLIIGSDNTTGYFAIQVDTCNGMTIAVGASCTVGITFNAQAQGVLTGSLIVNGNVPGGAASAVLTGTGYAFAVSPVELNFEPEAVGASSQAQTVTLSNMTGVVAGIASVKVSTAAPASSSFAIVQNTCGSSVAPMSSCQISVDFSPSTFGLVSGSLIVTDTAAGSQITASLSGTGFEQALNPVLLTFGPTVIGSRTAPQTVVATNPGPGTILFSTDLTGADFVVETDGCNGAMVPQGGTCAVNIAFSPIAAGTRNGSVTVSGGSYVATAGLTGTGIGPGQLLLTPTVINFGSVAVGSPATGQQITVSNVGGVSITPGAASVISASGDYKIQQNSCTASLAPGTGCTAVVTFTPASGGPASGTFSISPGGPALTTQLTGNGLTPATDGISPTALKFGSVAVGGQSAPLVVTISNTGDQSLTLSAISNTSDFTVVPPDCILVIGGGACGIKVIFTPTASGTLVGSLTISDSLGHTLTVALSGTGLATSIVTGLTFTMSAASGLKPVPGGATETVVSGDLASYLVTITDTGTTAGTVALVCTGAPAGYTCSASGGLSPGSVALTSGTPSAVTVTASPTATASNADANGRASSRWGSVQLSALALILVIPFWPSRLRLKKRQVSLGLVLLLAGLAGCGTKATGGGGGGGGGGGTGSTYTLTLTASAPGVQQSVSMTLVVEQ